MLLQCHSGAAALSFQCHFQVGLVFLLCFSSVTFVVLFIRLAVAAVSQFGSVCSNAVPREHFGSISGLFWGLFGTVSGSQSLLTIQRVFKLQVDSG